jgi:hypothetical protein
LERRSSENVRENVFGSLFFTGIEDIIVRCRFGEQVVRQVVKPRQMRLNAPPGGYKFSSSATSLIIKRLHFKTMTSGTDPLWSDDGRAPPTSRGA